MIGSGAVVGHRRIECSLTTRGWCAMSNYTATGHGPVGLLRVAVAVVGVIFVVGIYPLPRCGRPGGRGGKGFALSGNDHRVVCHPRGFLLAGHP